MKTFTTSNPRELLELRTQELIDARRRNEAAVEEMVTSARRVAEAELAHAQALAAMPEPVRSAA